MVTEPTMDRPRDASGALGVALAAAALLFVLARLLLAAQGGVGRVGDAGRDAVDVAVVVTGAACLVRLWARARSGTSAHLARELPVLLVGIPPTVTAAALWFSGDAALGSVAAPMASSTAAGLLTAAVIAPALRALVVRGVLESPDATTAPSIAAAIAWTLMATGLASFAIAIANVSETSLEWARRPEGGVALAALAAVLGLTWLAGVLTGRGVGADAESIARRLDALGHDATPGSGTAIVPTDLDQTGELFGELERLRARLDHEQRLYQDALERTQAADAAKADFLTAVSHELRTPLHTVGGYAQVLLSGIAKPLSDAQAEDVRLIQAGGRQLLELVNDILDLSMIESGELRLSFASTDLGALVDEVVRIHQPLVRDRAVRLGAELVELPDVVCDRRRIAQILTNLLSNAIKFTERGEIIVRSDTPGDGTVSIAVTDTGVGIAPDELPLIFEEYQQAGTISRRKKGTGLGLAIARSIALAHGGSLAVRSEVGRGSTFTLVLPIDPPRRPAAIDIAEEAARALVRARNRGESVEEDPRGGAAGQVTR